MNKMRRFGETAALYTSDFEIRAGSDGPRFTGYAALYDVESDAPWLPFKETVRPSAFENSLRANGYHAFVLNHDDNVLFASTRTQRLRLSSDQRGLLTDAQMPDTSAAHDLKALYDAGEVRGMSFAFKPTRGGMRVTDTGRELVDVKLGHVTVITTMTPGYSQTGDTIAMRALAAELSADPDDLDGLLDGLRAGRPLTPDELDLLGRLADSMRSEPSPEPDPAPAVDFNEKWRAVLETKTGAHVPGARPGGPTGAQPADGDQSMDPDDPPTDKE